ncbi:MAG: tetratricopeptide repeat protein [candidate division WOR-3 bacterium]
MKCLKCNFENPEGQKFCGECGASLIQKPAKEEFRLLTILFADLSGFTKLSHSLDPEDVQDIANICFEYLNRPIIKHGGTIHKYEGDLIIALFGLPVAHEDDPERTIKASLEMMSLVPEINEKLSGKLKMKTDLGLHIGINSGTVAVGEVGSKEKKEYTIMGDVVNLTSRLKDIAKNGEIVVSEPVFRASRYLFNYEVLPPVHIKGIEGKVKIFKPLKIKEKPEPKRGIQGLYSPLVGRDKELKSLREWVKGLERGRFGTAFILGDAGLGKSRLFEELKGLIANAKLPITILEARCLSYGETIPYFPFLQIIKKFFGIEDSDSSEIVQERLLKKTKSLFSDGYKDIVPYLGYLFSIRFADELDEKVKYLEPKDLKIQLFLSVRKLLKAVSHSQPVLLAIDDFHWIDPVSLELIEFLFDSPEPFPFFFLGLSRIEKEKLGYKIKERLREKLGNEYLEIILKPLDNDSSTRLTYNLLKVPGFPEEFRDKILAKAAGNPFYLEEIIRSLIDSGILVFEDGVWKLSTSYSLLSNLKIPDTVQAVIASRMDRLDPDVREILQIASAMGRSFYPRILQNLCEFEELMLTLHLATLEEYEYIQKFRSEPELEYIFRHPLIQEVVYNSLLKRRRRELHRRIGETIEKLFHNRLDDFAEILAHQYTNSDNFEKAIEWLKRAGEKAKKRFANDEAIGYFERVISVIRENNLLPIHRDSLIEFCEALGDICNLKSENERAIKNYQEIFDNTTDKIVMARVKRKIAYVYRCQGRLDDSLRILGSAQEIIEGNTVDEIIEKSQIHISRCWILRIKGEMESAIKEVERGLAILERSDIDEKRIKSVKARGFNNLGAIFCDKGEYDRAIELFEKYLRISEEIGDRRGIGTANNNLGLIYYNRGEYDRAIELFQKHLRITEEIGDRRGIGTASNNLGLVYYNKGEYDRAIELFQKHLRITEEIGDKWGIGIASNNLGTVYKEKGEYDRAIELYEKKLRISEEIGDKRGVGMAIGNLANVYFSKGEHDRAIDLHQKHLRISEEIGDKRGIGTASAGLGNVYLEIGNLEDAEENILKSKKICEEIGDKWEVINTHCSLSELLIKKGKKLEDAIEYVDKALKLAEEINSKEKRADCYFTYGKIYSKCSAVIYHTKAKEYFKKAMEIYKELKNKKTLADCYLEYAKMLRDAELCGLEPEEKSETYFKRALEIYQGLKLPHKIKEIEKYISIGFR